MPVEVIGTVDIGNPGTAAGRLGKAEDAAHASGDTGVMVLAVRGDAGTTLVGADGDYAPLQVDANGALRVNISATVVGTIDLRRGLTLLFASISVAGAGDNTIVAADATRKIKVLSYGLVADAAVTAQWKSGAGTNLSGAMSLAVNGGIAEGGGNSPAQHWLFETAVNQALVLSLGGAVGVRGRMTYFLEA